MDDNNVDTSVANGFIIQWRDQFKTAMLACQSSDQIHKSLFIWLYKQEDFELNLKNCSDETLIDLIQNIYYWANQQPQFTEYQLHLNFATYMMKHLIDLDKIQLFTQLDSEIQTNIFDTFFEGNNLLIDKNFQPVRFTTRTNFRQLLVYIDDESTLLRFLQSDLIRKYLSNLTDIVRLNKFQCYFICAASTRQTQVMDFFWKELQLADPTDLSIPIEKLLSKLLSAIFVKNYYPNFTQTTHSLDPEGQREVSLKLRKYNDVLFDSQFKRVMVKSYFPFFHMPSPGKNKILTKIENSPHKLHIENIMKIVDLIFTITKNNIIFNFNQILIFFESSEYESIINHPSLRPFWCHALECVSNEILRFLPHCVSHTFDFSSEPLAQFKGFCYNTLAIASIHQEKKTIKDVEKLFLKASEHNFIRADLALRSYYLAQLQTNNSQLISTLLQYYQEKATHQKKTPMYLLVAEYHLNLAYYFQQSGMVDQARPHLTQAYLYFSKAKSATESSKCAIKNAYGKSFLATEVIRGYIDSEATYSAANLSQLIDQITNKMAQDFQILLSIGTPSEMMDVATISFTKCAYNQDSVKHLLLSIFTKLEQPTSPSTAGVSANFSKTT